MTASVYFTDAKSLQNVYVGPLGAYVDLYAMRRQRKDIVGRAATVGSVWSGISVTGSCGRSEMLAT